MSKKAVAILIIFLPLFAVGQNGALLSELLLTSKGSNLIGASEKLEEFEQQLQKKTYPSDYALLQTVFKKTQQKFLKQYSQYSDLNEVFASGKYDCLTATSLFSILLTDLHFQYRIIETNYHIFLMVPTTTGDVLIETTDRFNGFVTEKEEIEKRIGSYKQNMLASSDKFYYSYHFSLYQNVDPHQLAGLLFYNQAVKAFNNKDFISSADLLDKAKTIYESPRVAELAVILIEATLESNLNESSKLMILERYKIYWEQRSRLMAAR